MAFTSYVVDNDQKFRNAIAKASEVSQDLRIPFSLILADFYKSEQAIWKLKGPGRYPVFKNSSEKYNEKTGRRLKKQGDGSKSAYQLAKIKAVGFDYPLLVRTGALAASLSGPSNPGSISKVTNLSLVFGTSVPYGIYHQSDEPRTKIPLRKFLFIGPEASRFATSDQMGRLERWKGYITDHIGREIRKAGLDNG